MVPPTTRQPIRELPTHVANQIAAGEVIERPASVVKELLENAIDAAAHNIDIDVEQGGVALIRVRDDGHGISHDDLSLAIAPHATSKLQNAEELTRIQSLGFRGEALASIASVSRLTLSSKTTEDAEGWQITGDSGGPQPVAHPVGTTVEMRDLFYNTPARRKFLRTQRTEFLHIEDVVKRLALSHFVIGFILRHNGRQIFRLRPVTGQEQRRQRIKALLGKAFEQHALELVSEAGDLRMSGWVVKPEMSRSQADIQYLYLNGRMIRDRLVTHAVRQAFGDEVPTGRYPAYLLYLEVDPAQVDVNVHPTKHEVRFRQARTVHDFLFSALDRCLHEGVEMVQERGGSIGQAVPGSRNRLHPAIGSVAEQRGHYRQLYEVTRKDQSVSAPLGKAISSIDSRFILAENGEAVLLIDALEARRVIARHFLQETGSDVKGRPLLIPETFQLDAALVIAAGHYAESIERLGFHIAPLGEESVVVRQIPAVLERCDMRRVVNTLLERLARTGEVDEHLLQALADEITLDGDCSMTLAEMNEILRQLEGIDSVISSPRRVWRQLDGELVARLLEEKYP